MAEQQSTQASIKELRAQLARARAQEDEATRAKTSADEAYRKALAEELVNVPKLKSTYDEKIRKLDSDRNLAQHSRVLYDYGGQIERLRKERDAKVGAYTRKSSETKKKLDAEAKKLQEKTNAVKSLQTRVEELELKLSGASRDEIEDYRRLIDNQKLNDLKRQGKSDSSNKGHHTRMNDGLVVPQKIDMGEVDKAWAGVGKNPLDQADNRRKDTKDWRSVKMPSSDVSEKTMRDWMNNKLWKPIRSSELLRAWKERNPNTGNGWRARARKEHARQAELKDYEKKIHSDIALATRDYNLYCARNTHAAFPGKINQIMFSGRKDLTNDERREVRQILRGLEADYDKDIAAGRRVDLKRLEGDRSRFDAWLTENYSNQCHDEGLKKIAEKHTFTKIFWYGKKLIPGMRAANKVSKKELYKKVKPKLDAVRDLIRKVYDEELKTKYDYGHRLKMMKSSHKGEIVKNPLQWLLCNGDPSCWSTFRKWLRNEGLTAGQLGLKREDEYLLGIWRSFKKENPTTTEALAQMRPDQMSAYVTASARVDYSIAGTFDNLHERTSNLASALMADKASAPARNAHKRSIDSMRGNLGVTGKEEVAPFRTDLYVLEDARKDVRKQALAIREERTRLNEIAHGFVGSSVWSSSESVRCASASYCLSVLEESFSVAESDLGNALIELAQNIVPKRLAVIKMAGGTVPASKASVVALRATANDCAPLYKIDGVYGDPITIFLDLVVMTESAMDRAKLQLLKDLKGDQKKNTEKTIDQSLLASVRKLYGVTKGGYRDLWEAHVYNTLERDYRASLQTFQTHHLVSLRSNLRVMQDIDKNVVKLTSHDGANAAVFSADLARIDKLVKSLKTSGTLDMRYFEHSKDYVMPKIFIKDYLQRYQKELSVWDQRHKESYSLWRTARINMAEFLQSPGGVLLGAAVGLVLAVATDGVALPFIFGVAYSALTHREGHYAHKVNLENSYITGRMSEEDYDKSVDASSRDRWRAFLVDSAIHALFAGVTFKFNAKFDSMVEKWIGQSVQEAKAALKESHGLVYGSARYWVEVVSKGGRGAVGMLLVKAGLIPGSKFATNAVTQETTGAVFAAYCNHEGLEKNPDAMRQWWEAGITLMTDEGTRKVVVPQSLKAYLNDDLSLKKGVRFTKEVVRALCNFRMYQCGKNAADGSAAILRPGRRSAAYQKSLDSYRNSLRLVYGCVGRQGTMSKAG